MKKLRREIWVGRDFAEPGRILHLYLKQIILVSGFGSVGGAVFYFDGNFLQENSETQDRRVSMFDLTEMCTK